MRVSRFEELIAWQKARELAASIYAVTRTGTFHRDYSLVDQIRRAAVSVGSNIAEGFDRGNNKEFLSFLGIAKGSAAEVRSQLYTALDVGHLSHERFSLCFGQAEEVAKLISGLSASLRKSSIAGTRYHQLPTSSTTHSKL